MKNNNRKQKALNETEINYGMLILPQELRSEYTKHLHGINIFDERGRMFCQCKIQYHQVRGLKGLYAKHKSKAGDVIGYAWEKDGIHLTFPRRLIFGFHRKKRYGFLSNSAA